MFKGALSLLVAGLFSVTAGAAYALDSDVTATLRVQIYGSDREVAVLEAAEARFKEKYPNVTFENSLDTVAEGWGAFGSKVVSQFAANRDYDVYHVAVEVMRMLAERNLFVPLDDRMAGTDLIEEYAPSLIAFGQYKDQTYFATSAWATIMINYNRAAFNERGVPLPQAGWTWDDFVVTAKAMTEKDASGTTTKFGYEIPNAYFGLMPWFFSNGTSPLNEDWTASNMMDPKVKETIQFLHDLVHVHGVSPLPGSAFNGDDQFINGTVAMINRGRWIMNKITDANMDMDIAAFPSRVSGTTVLGGGGYGISSKTDNPDLAFAFVQEMLSPETMTDVAAAGRIIPARKSIAESGGVLKFPDSAELYYAALDDIKTVPSPANFETVNEIFMRHFTDIMLNNIGIDEGIAAAHAEIEAAMAKLASRN